MKSSLYLAILYRLLFVIFLTVLFPALPQVYGQDFSTTFEHQAITVSDLDKSAEFYMEVLGLKEIENETGKPTRRWFSLGGDLQLHLLEDGTDDISVNKSIHLAVTVSDFDAFVENLRSKGISFTDWPGNVDEINVRPDGVRQVYILDPDGYSIEINSTAD